MNLLLSRNPLHPSQHGTDPDLPARPVFRPAAGGRPTSAAGQCSEPGGATVAPPTDRVAVATAERPVAEVADTSLLSWILRHSRDGLRGAAGGMADAGCDDAIGSPSASEMRFTVLGRQLRPKIEALDLSGLFRGNARARAAGLRRDPPPSAHSV